MIEFSTFGEGRRSVFLETCFLWKIPNSLVEIPQLIRYQHFVFGVSQHTQDIAVEHRLDSNDDI